MESSESESAATAAESANQSIVLPGQQDIEQKTENLVENAKQPVVSTSTDESTKCAKMSKKSKSRKAEGKDGEQQKGDDVSQTMTENKQAASKQQTKEATEEKTEGNDGQRTVSPRLQKKTKKTKKKEQQQQPVSEEAIPLPPPPMESAK